MFLCNGKLGLAGQTSGLGAYRDGLASQATQLHASPTAVCQQFMVLADEDLQGQSVHRSNFLLHDCLNNLSYSRVCVTQQWASTGSPQTHDQIKPMAVLMIHVCMQE